MRLIILSYDYAPNNGGIARLCKEIRKQCIATGTDYLVVTPVRGPEEDNVVRITGRRGVVEWKILRFLRSIKREGDIILTGTYHPDGLLALLSRIPTYCLAHGTEFLEGGSFFRRLLWPSYKRVILSKPIKIIANSNYTAGWVKKSCPAANVVALPLAVDHVHFHPSVPKSDDGLLRLCSVSRLERFKAQDFVIKTIASLPEQYRRKIRFEIAGKGPYKTELEQLVLDLGLENQVRFLGFVSDEELCDFYSRNDVFVLTTREVLETNEVEGFGLVFTEAQACGTACIGSRSGGIPDAVEEGNGGWLIHEDSSEELSVLLRHLIDNHSIAIKEGQKARRRIEECCIWTFYFEQLMNLLTHD